MLRAVVCITLKEALARLADGDPLEVRFEQRPNNGITKVNKLPRTVVLKMLEAARAAFETGKEGQAANFGIYVSGIINEQFGFLFLPTKPECRLTDQQLKESLQRGSGADIFSSDERATVS